MFGDYQVCIASASCFLQFIISKANPNFFFKASAAPKSFCIDISTIHSLQWLKTNAEELWEPLWAIISTKHCKTSQLGI